MDSAGIANDKNDTHTSDIQLLVPTVSHHHIVSPEQSSNGTEHRKMARIDSSGTIQELALSRRPSAVVSAMQRPSGNITVQRSLLIE